MRPPPFVTQQWEKLPGSVRSVIQEESRAVGRELRTVRRPRDLRRFARDPDAVGRIAVPLEPALDRIAALVAKGTVPIHPTVAGGVVAATGAASAGVSSALQLLALLGIEAPPAAVSVAGAAGAVAVASELVEFYLIACVARDELRRADRDDPALLRQVLIETYLGHDPSGPGTFGRVAGAVVRRAVSRMAPVIGIPLAARSSLRDLRRARAAVDRLVAEG